MFSESRLVVEISVRRFDDVINGNIRVYSLNVGLRDLFIFLYDM